MLGERRNFWALSINILYTLLGGRGHDHMVDGFTTTYAISADHH
jgi:hypothetical protein